MDTTWALFVEDDERLARSMIRALARQHIRAHQAMTLAGIWTLIEEHGTPVITILDYDLGQEMTGIDVLASLRASDHPGVMMFWTGSPLRVADELEDQTVAILAKAEVARLTRAIETVVAAARRP